MEAAVYFSYKTRRLSLGAPELSGKAVPRNLLELYPAAYHGIYHAAKKVPAELREDFTQDLWVSLLKASFLERFWEKPQPESAKAKTHAFRAYLLVTIQNNTSNWWRTRRRRWKEEPFDPQDPVLDVPVGSEDVMLTGLLVHRCAKEFPHAVQKILELGRFSREAVGRENHRGLLALRDGFKFKVRKSPVPHHLIVKRPVVEKGKTMKDITNAELLAEYTKCPNFKELGRRFSASDKTIARKVRAAQVQIEAPHGGDVQPIPAPPAGRGHPKGSRNKPKKRGRGRPKGSRNKPRLLREYDEGATVQEIAEKHRMTVEAASDRIQQERNARPGRPAERPGRPAKRLRGGATNADLLKQHEQGASLRDLANLHGIAASSVHTRIALAKAEAPRPSIKEAMIKVMTEEARLCDAGISVLKRPNSKGAMNADGVVAALTEKGWLPNAKNPRQYVGYLLSTEKGLFEAAKDQGRGFYKVKAGALSKLREEKEKKQVAGALFNLREEEKKQVTQPKPNSLFTVSVIIKDDKYQDMKMIWDSCEKVGAVVPNVVWKYFKGKKPQAEGFVEVLPVHKDEILAREVSIPLKDLPQGASVLRISF